MCEPDSMDPNYYPDYFSPYESFDDDPLEDFPPLNCIEEFKLFPDKEVSLEVKEDTSQPLLSSPPIVSPGGPVSPNSNLYYKNFFDAPIKSSGSPIGMPDAYATRNQSHNGQSINDQLIDQFKNQLASCFLSDIPGKNVLKKELVIKLTKYIRKHYISEIPKIQRDETRVVKLYYKKYLPYAELIIECVKQHREELAQVINLDEIKSKKIK